MKIATWNIERLKHATKLGRMRMEIEKQDADVLVLTEKADLLYSIRLTYTILLLSRSPAL
jgi:hypothetical protein